MSSLDNIQRAAMVVASLDRKAADAVLERLPHHQAAAIRHAMISLSDDEGEQQQAIRSFLQPSAPAPPVATPVSRDPFVTPNHPESPLEALCHADTTAIASCLVHERASTISAVLLALPGKKAAAILKLMDPRRRDRILNNMGLGHVPYSSAVSDIAARILELCQTHASMPSAPNAEQHDSLRDILDEFEDHEHQEMLASLVDVNPLLARRLTRARAAHDRA
jgi:flagellar motor switch protein FliG